MPDKAPNNVLVKGIGNEMIKTCLCFCVLTKQHNTTAEHKKKNNQKEKEATECVTVFFVVIQ
jgi:hypothetical protein